MLAEAAIDSEHIAATQSALLSRLIAARDIGGGSNGGVVSDIGGSVVSPSVESTMPPRTFSLDAPARPPSGEQDLRPSQSVFPTSDSDRWLPNPTSDSMIQMGPGGVEVNGNSNGVNGPSGTNGQ